MDGSVASAPEVGMVGDSGAREHDAFRRGSFASFASGSSSDLGRTGAPETGTGPFVDEHRRPSMGGSGSGQDLPGVGRRGSGRRDGTALFDSDPLGAFSVAQ